MKLTLEKFLRYIYNSHSTYKLKPIRPLSRFAVDCFNMLMEENEREAIIKFCDMREKVRNLKK